MYIAFYELENDNFIMENNIDYKTICNDIRNEKPTIVIEDLSVLYKKIRRYIITISIFAFHRKDCIQLLGIVDLAIAGSFRRMQRSRTIQEKQKRKSDYGGWRCSYLILKN